MSVNKKNGAMVLITFVSLERERKKKKFNFTKISTKYGLAKKGGREELGGRDPFVNWRDPKPRPIAQPRLYKGYNKIFVKRGAGILPAVPCLSV